MSNHPSEQPPHDALLSMSLLAVGRAFGAGLVWLCNRNDSSALMRLDPVTNQVQARLPFSSPPCASLVALDQTIWVMSFFSGDGNSVQLGGVSDA